MEQVHSVIGGVAPTIMLRQARAIRSPRRLRAFCTNHSDNTNSDNIAEHMAPSVDEFKKTLVAVRNGDTCADDARRQKHGRLVHTLAEAERALIGEALRDATSISIQQDVRCPVLVVTFACADSDLVVTNGVIGQCDLAACGFGLSAGGVHKATTYCCLQLATPSSTTQTDEEVVEAIRDKTELFVADGASDEQLAGTPGLINQQVGVLQMCMCS